MTPSWRRLLLPLVPLYDSVIRTKRWLRDHGLLRRRSLGHPVLSIGSLSSGGAGKTPVVLLLAKLLLERGVEVRILSRGYGRASRKTERVDAAGDANQFGDEPLLLARRLPTASVFVGANRYSAGKLAEDRDTEKTRAVYILDDGFQHQALARDIDILLVTQQDVGDMLLPAGNLREPLQRVEAATFLVVREEEPQVLPALRGLGYSLPPVVTIKRSLVLPETLRQAARPMIFSGLARPTGFLNMLREAGVDTEANHAFADHHRYSMQDVDSLLAAAKQAARNCFLTTEKDAVKLTPAMLDRLHEVGLVHVAELSVEVVDGDSTIETILAQLPGGAPIPREKITS